MCEKEISCKRLTVIHIRGKPSIHHICFTWHNNKHFTSFCFLSPYISLFPPLIALTLPPFDFILLCIPPLLSLFPLRSSHGPTAHRRQGDVIPPLPGDVGNCTLCALGHGRVCVCVWVYVWKCVWVASRLSFWMRDTNGKKRRRETVVGWLWNLFQ